MMKKFKPVMKKYPSELFITIEYLEGIAAFRFAMREIASLLNLSYIQGTVERSQQEHRLKLEIMQLAEELCLDSIINTVDFADGLKDVEGPALYLLKLMVRQYGYPCLKHGLVDHPWIVPKGLQLSDKVTESIYMHKVTGSFFLGKSYLPICDL